MASTDTLFSSKQMADLVGSAVGPGLVHIGQSPSADHAGQVAWVEPENEAHVASILNLAHEHGLTVCPVGAGTQMDGCCLGTIPDLVISMARMNRVLQYSPEDMVVTVEPGVSLAKLQTVLGERSQILPIDPFVSNDATIGGITAVGSSGPRRTLYGPLRDMVIGLRVVYPNGEIVKTGGKVVKNVAGYDMTKLFVGSYGSLAVITELTFRLRPLPQHRETCVLRGTAEQCAQLRALLIASHLVPSRAEAVTGFSAPLDGKEWTLLVDCDENQPAAASQTAQLLLWAEELGMAASVVRASAADELWDAHRQQGTAVGTIVRFQCPPTELLRIVEAIASKLSDHGCSGMFSLGVLIGVGRLFTTSVPAAVSVDVVQFARTAVESVGGSAVIEKSPTEVRKLVDPFGQVQAESLMQGIKATIDPKRILNRGRYIGGM